MIAVAPIVLVWFGFGPLAKILVVAFVCFFPIAVNAFEGFPAMDVRIGGQQRTQFEELRSYNLNLTIT